MAKKEKKENKKVSAEEFPENMLPQNILPVGERVEENKNIYISQAAYKAIHKFTKNKTTNESGGMLIGTIIEEFGKTNIVISGFVEAKYCDATPTTLKFTHETWEYVHKEIEKKHKDKKIVGWIHTHPDFGIFLSEYDKFIHQNFFSEDYQVAYVVDPIQNIEGFYFWINGNIEKCKGFYIYDKTGTQINVDIEKDEQQEEKAEQSLFSVQNIIIAALFVVVVFLIFSNISTNKKLIMLEEQQAKVEIQQQMLVSSANQALFQMEETITAQEQEIAGLKDLLSKAGIVEETEEPSEDTENDSEAEEENTGNTETENITEETTETTEEENSGSTEEENQTNE